MDLQRFVDAQAGGVHERALAEVRSGRKTGHWMWFVYPQLRGLGHSATAQRYGLAGLDEAAAHLRHPVLGPRLREALEADRRRIKRVRLVRVREPPAVHAPD